LVASFAEELAIQNASLALELDATSQPCSDTFVNPLTETARGTVGDNAKTQAELPVAVTLATARAPMRTGSVAMMAEKKRDWFLVSSNHPIAAALQIVMECRFA
jgi:hypothetical protein